MVFIFDESQILDGLILARMWADPRKHTYILDHMNYASSPTQIYDIEGTYANPLTDGGAVRLETGAVAGNRVRLGNTGTLISPGRDLIMAAELLTLTLTNTRYFIGVFEAYPTAAVPPVEPGDGLYFRRVDVGAVANWFAVSRNNAVETAVDTGIVGDGNNHEFKITLFGTRAQFFIDGVLKATITTNIPGGVLLFPALTWVTQDAVAKSGLINSLFLYNKR